MVKMARVASVGMLAGLAIGGTLLALVGVAQAVSTTDKPAALLVWPKIVVDSSGLFGPATNTLIQLSNTSTTNLKQAHCFYVNANSHCIDTGTVCRDSSDCENPVPCVPGWTEIDFNVVITKDQPLGWYANEGLQNDDLPPFPPGHCQNTGQVCFSNQNCGVGDTCVLGQTNVGTAVPPVPEDPFVGSLKCIEYDPSRNPPAPDQSATTNTLKGEATILVKAPASGSGSATDGVDVQKYSAIGLLATPAAGAPPVGNVLQIGRAKNAPSMGVDPTQEYAACPTTLILNHLFDGATDPLAVWSPTAPSSTATTTTAFTDLTLVPCGDNFLTQTPGHVTAHFLVISEFEQRFSISQTVDCFFESQLSLIGTRDATHSIFSAGVSGTIAGQTRIQGVSTADTGRGLLGVARLFVNNSGSSRPAGAGYNLHQQGNPPAGTQPDLITIP